MCAPAYGVPMRGLGAPADQAGTPLDMTSNIVQSYIQGREINMMDIHKLFFQKYLEKIKQQTPAKVVP